MSNDESARLGIDLDPEQIRTITTSKRFLAADRTRLDLGEIATWDEFLLREHRLLVPVDVQALYVPDGRGEPMVRLPMLVAGETGRGAESFEEGMPDPFDPGEERPSGVHLHWAMPDALLRGSVTERADGSPNKLSMPVLPDRWVVLRIVLPVGATDVVTTGWVIEADRAVAVPLGSWSEGATLPSGVTASGETIDPDDLTGTVGGSVSWSAVYDAVLHRFAFHDPLDDVTELAPEGVDEDCAAYVVAGWWSDPARDPLDSARSADSLDELLDRLRWRLLHEWGDERWAAKEEQAEAELRESLGLGSEDRWSSRRPITGVPVVGDAPRTAGTGAGFVPIDDLFVETSPTIASPAFATEAAARYVSAPWHLRSSLLHGSVYGVPVAGPVVADRRPAAERLSVAFGFDDDDVLAAFASSSGATVAQRRATERLLTAFTSQKVNRLGTADGLAELEEHEHTTAFSSVPAGSAGTDRYLQRVQTGGVGGLGLGHTLGKDLLVAHELQLRSDVTPRTPRTRHARPLAPRDGAPARASLDGAEIVFSAQAKPDLFAATELMIHDIARSRVGDVLAPTEAQVVDRPAPRWTMFDDPMVAVRGAARSLRHGQDGRGSPDGKLTCRWPTHVITEISGVIAPDRFVRSLGSGAVPREILTLAREAVIHDPYHDAWIARAVTPPGGDRTAVLGRLQAESVLRFGDDGIYDGATIAFDANVPRTPAARRRRAAAASTRILPDVRQQQVMVADELHKFSLYRGVDPDVVGVTTWAQPWVPIWLEWEVSVEGLDPPTIDAWRLGQVDLEPADDVTVSGDAVVLRGRSLLTTGAAATLHSAIDDWLVAEDALDAAAAGLIDEATEDRYRTLAAAVERLDVVTTALDGVRSQLLGFPARDGLRRPSDAAGAITDPAPTSPPRAVLAGAMTLTRARLLDAFGRTLDVPVDAVRTTTRTSVRERPGALGAPPRLLRPARWLLRLVDAATEVGAEGDEARVDQIEPSLQVNPVAGFLMPDHLDESLEVFGVDGSPLGELLHEPVSGGVMWEIAAGRDGPADAGPNYGLTSAQRPLGRFAAGLVAADAAARGGVPLDPDGPTESALSSLLRAIDTTLWTVDTFAALGSEHVAGLVGRPIGVVRAQLRLELKPPDDVDLSDPDRAAEWAAAEALAARYRFPVRIGELTRTDDGVLGFFVDDDYSRFRLVDKVIAGTAREAGRSRGQLGLYADSNGLPAATSIRHPYIRGADDADTLLLHVGQTVTLTILMHPAGRATLTSGVLPRKALGLARDWVGPGLAAIAPSLRTGPVLVETDLAEEGQVRLPKVSVFGTDQNFLWRDTPATWRTDAILAATQSALLPDTPAEFREGWIRVAPESPTDGTGS
jgi:hypothetical protein